MKRNVLAVIGPFPPPVHGMSKNLEAFHRDLLESSADVMRIDLSPGTLRKGWVYHVRKISKVFFALMRIFANFRRIGSVYIPPDSGWGLVYTLAFVGAARLLSMNIYLHHRSFSYFNKFSFLFLLVSRIGGVNIRSIYLCDCMARRHEEVYGVTDSLVVSNSMHILSLGDARKIISNFTSENPLTLGFMSNISREKGLYRVLAVYDRLREINMPVKLKLGGVCTDPQIEIELAERVELDPNITYVGFVGDKTSYFSTVDVFLFPTMYDTEAQPNVLFEAAAFGIPSLTVDRGCISEDIHKIGGLVFELESFEASAVDAICGFCTDFESLKELSSTVKERVFLDGSSSLIRYKKLIDFVSRGKAFK